MMYFSEGMKRRKKNVKEQKAGRKGMVGILNQEI